MVHSAEDLQQLKGVGKVLAKRLFDAGLDSFGKIAQAGEAGLAKVRGLPPRSIPSILAQSRELAKGAHQEGGAAAEALGQRLSEVKGQLQALAEATRERFEASLAGKPGKKLSSDLVRIDDALERMRNLGKKGRKKAGRALLKAQKRVAGLEEASLKKVHKGLKKARKAVLKAL